MSSACRSALLVAVLICSAAAAAELRVCADPDNLPFSDEAERGFENRIARLVAEDMGVVLRYEWMPLRRGFVRKTIGAGSCEVFIGVPRDFDRVLTTRAYYRSSYVFVDGPAARGIDSFDDPRLAKLSIGVQLIGNDLAATPAGHALAARGNIDNVRGYTIFGDGPAPRRMVSAIADGILDVALIWGPQAGYFAARASSPLEVHVARAAGTHEGAPLEFDIAMGVARGEPALRDRLDSILERRRADIDTILAEYSVPRTDLPAAARP